MHRESKRRGELMAAPGDSHQGLCRHSPRVPRERGRMGQAFQTDVSVSLKMLAVMLVAVCIQIKIFRLPLQWKG